MATLLSSQHAQSTFFKLFFLPESDGFITIAGDGIVRVWKGFERPKETAIWPTGNRGGGITGVPLMPDGRSLLINGVLWNLQSGGKSERYTFDYRETYEGKEYIQSFPVGGAFINGGESTIMASDKLFIYSFSNNNVTFFYDQGKDYTRCGGSRSVVVSPNQKYVSMILENDEGWERTSFILRVLELGEDPSFLKHWDTPGLLQAIAPEFSPDGKYVVYSDYLLHLTTFPDRVLYHSFLPDGKKLDREAVLGFPTCWSNAVFTPNSKTFFCRYGRKIFRWGISFGDLLDVFEETTDQSSATLSLALNADGTVLASFDDSGNLSFWKI